MDPAQLKDGITELRDCIERDVASGFSTPHEITEHALEMIAQDYDARELRPHAERLVREVVEAHRAAERLWPRITDCDRLAADVIGPAFSRASNVPQERVSMDREPRALCAESSGLGAVQRHEPASEAQSPNT